MKHKLLLWGCNLLLLALTSVLQSWVPLNAQHQSVFTRFVANSEATVIDESAAQRHINNLQQFKKSQSFKRPLSLFTINYGMTQYGTPYLDANLSVVVYDTAYNFVTADFLFWDDNKQFTNLGYSKLILEIHAPIFDQWEGYGIYTFTVDQCHSIQTLDYGLSSSQNCTSLKYQSAPRSGSSTPDYYTFALPTVTVDIANGDIINIFASATPDW
jgi:hypothetical protein